MTESVKYYKVAVFLRAYSCRNKHVESGNHKFWQQYCDRLRKFLDMQTRAISLAESIQIFTISFTHVWAAIGTTGKIGMHLFTDRYLNIYMIMHGCKWIVQPNNDTLRDV